MKKFSVILEALFFWTFFIILPILILIQTLFAAHQHYDADPRTAILAWEHAPEQTAYLDILAIPDPDDFYAETSGQPPCWYVSPERNSEKSLPISSGSEIAQYQQEDYQSLSQHTDSVSQILIYDSEYNQTTGWEIQAMLYLNAPDTIEQLFQNYQTFKAAYVDENGHILDITDSFTVIYEERQENAFLADGKNLTLRISGIAPEKAEQRKLWTKIRSIALPSLLFVGFVYMLLLAAQKRKTDEEYQQQKLEFEQIRKERAAKKSEPEPAEESDIKKQKKSKKEKAKK